MPKSVLQNAKIKGVSVVVGENEFLIDNYPFLYNNSDKHLARLKNRTGVNKHYYTNATTTAMNLGKQATLNLLHKLNIDKSTIDAIVCVCQTNDYLKPANASVLHSELELSVDCLTVDINAACVGYITGLHQAFMLVNSGYKRVLLVAGDTFCKTINEKDKINAILFGDGVSATIVEYDESASKSYFSFKSNGSGFDKLFIKAGGMRCPISADTSLEKENEDGSFRSDDELYMNGFEVFNFTLETQPSMVEEVLALAGKTKDEIDYFVLHQANKYIIDTIADSANLPKEKVPTDAFSEYGNLTSASIPSALCYQLKNDLTNSKKQMLLQGFGLGLAWGACVVEFDNVICLDITNYINK